MTAKPSSAGRLRLTSEGLAWFATTAVLGGLGWFKSLNLLLLLAYMMLALLVINGVLARSRSRHIRAVQVALPPIFAGESVRTCVTLHNKGNHSISATTSNTEAQWNAEVPPEGSIECRGVRRFPKRGRFPGPILTCGTAFPFGFLRAEREERTDEVIVLPALGRVEADGLRRWLLRQAGFEGRSRKLLRRVTTDLADVRGVRPYRSGDSIRAIHWRTSARRREVMVREYDAAPSPDLLVVVEPWLPAEATDTDRARLEAALSLAATIVNCWSRDFETRVALVVAIPNQHASLEASHRGETGLRDLLVPLADVHGTHETVTFPAAVLGRTAAKSARIVVSSRPDSNLSARLGRSLRKPFVALDPSQNLPWYQPPRAELS